MTVKKVWRLNALPKLRFQSCWQNFPTAAQ
jgi:hypothetical protein